MFTPMRILAFAPNCTSATAQAIAAVLEAKRAQYGLTTPNRCQIFMGNVSVECGGFTKNFENLNYREATIASAWKRLAPRAKELAHQPEKLANAAYASYTNSKGELRDDLGNGPEGNGNGWRYRGRGIIQLTGKANYERIGKALGLDLVRQPDLAAEWGTAAEIAMYFWKSKGCNVPADRNDEVGVRKIINGGTNGLQHVLDATKLARKIFV